MMGIKENLKMFGRKFVITSICTATILSAGAIAPIISPDASSPFMITASATQSRSDRFSKSYSLSGNKATDLVRVANAQVGKTKSNLGYTEAWCADFVTDCARLTKMSDKVIPYNYGSRGSCTSLYNYMVSNCGAKVVSQRQQGDLVFYYCSSCKKYVHVGIVSDGTYSIEGNYGGKVTKVKSSYTDSNGHTLKSGKIRRVYLRPNYSSNSNTSNWSSIDNGLYRITPQCAPNCSLDVCGSGCADGTNILTWSYYSQANQKFKAVRQSDGSYVFYDSNSGKVIDVKNGQVGDQVNVQLWPYNGTNAQKWLLKSRGNGWYEIVSKLNSNYCLDVTGAYSGEGANIEIYHRNNSSAQMFKFTQVSENGSYNENRGQTYYVTTKAGLNLRSKPSTSSSKLAAMPYRSSLTVYSISNGWAYCSYKGKTGYCSSSYISR